MHSKLISSMMMLALFSNGVAPMAHADEAAPAQNVVEVNQNASANETQNVVANHAQALENMDEADIANRLNAAADLTDAYANDPSKNLNAEEQSKVQNVAAAMRLHAKNPGEFKKNTLTALKHTSQTALISLSFAGSTVEQLAFLPLVALGGFLQGLSTNKIDKNLEAENSFFANPYAEGGTIFLEIIIAGPQAVPLFLALFTGVAANEIGDEVCATPRNDQHAKNICADYNAYKNKIDGSADIGASAVGFGIDHSVMFVIRGTENLIKRIFSHKKKKTN